MTRHFGTYVMLWRPTHIGPLACGLEMILVSQNKEMDSSTVALWRSPRSHDKSDWTFTSFNFFTSKDEHPTTWQTHGGLPPKPNPMPNPQPAPNPGGQTDEDTRQQMMLKWLWNDSEKCLGVFGKAESSWSEDPPNFRLLRVHSYTSPCRQHI